MTRLFGVLAVKCYMVVVQLFSRWSNEDVEAEDDGIDEEDEATSIRTVSVREKKRRRKEGYARCEEDNLSNEQSGAVMTLGHICADDHDTNAGGNENGRTDVGC